jgi:hypothetical protein
MAPPSERDSLLGSIKEKVQTWSEKHPVASLLNEELRRAALCELFNIFKDDTSPAGLLFRSISGLYAVTSLFSSGENINGIITDFQNGDYCKAVGTMMSFSGTIAGAAAGGISAWDPKMFNLSKTCLVGGLGAEAFADFAKLVSCANACIDAKDFAAHATEFFSAAMGMGMNMGLFTFQKDPAAFWVGLCAAAIDCGFSPCLEGIHHCCCSGDKPPAIN